MGRFHDLPKQLRWGGKEYPIYALIDPHDNTTRYIGISKDAEFRFYRHLRGGCGQRTMHWIDELEQSGVRSILQILETVYREDNMSSADLRRAAYEEEYKFNK